MPNPEVRAGRQNTIDRAVMLLEESSPENVVRYLALTQAWDHLKADPAKVHDLLADITADDETARHFGAWKMAQQILQAAGLPY